MFETGKDARGQRVVNGGKAHAAKDRLAGFRDLQNGHVLQMHVAVRDEPDEHDALHESQQIFVG